MFRKVNAFGRMIDCSCCVHDDVSKTGATVGLSTDVFIVLRKDRTVLSCTLYYYSSKLPSIPEVLYSMGVLRKLGLAYQKPLFFFTKARISLFQKRRFTWIISIISRVIVVFIT